MDDYSPKQMFPMTPQAQSSPMPSPGGTKRDYANMLNQKIHQSKNLVSSNSNMMPQKNQRVGKFSPWVGMAHKKDVKI